jgi:hypothetical protein
MVRVKGGQRNKLCGKIFGRRLRNNLKKGPRTSGRADIETKLGKRSMN